MNHGRRRPELIRIVTEACEAPTKNRWCGLTNLLFPITMVVLVVFLAGCHSLNGSSLKNSEGVAYYGQGQYDQALPYFQEAIRLDPANAEAYYNVASTYQRQAALHGQPSLLTQAESYYRACLDHSPSPETTVCCYRGLATSMSQRNQSDQALALLKDWESRNPNSVEPKLEMAYLMEAQGKNQEALALLQQSTNLAPADYRIYYKTGVLQQKLGNEETALAQYLMAARLAPSDQEIANRITVLQAKSDRRDVDPNALATVRTALPGALAPNSTNTANTANTVNPGALAANSTAPPVQQGVPGSPGNVSITPPNFANAESQADRQVASNNLPEVNQARWVQTTSATEQAPVAPTPGTTSEATPNASQAPFPTPSPVPTPAPATTSPLGSLPDGTGSSPIPQPVAVPISAPPASAGTTANAAATQPVLSTPAPATGTAGAATLAPPVSDNLPNRKNKTNDYGSGPPPIRAGAGL